MSARRRVVVAITARPSYSRIRSTLHALRAREDVELLVLCSGSALLDRYGRVAKLIAADGYTVVDELFTFVEGNDLVNMALTTSSTISQTAGALRRLAPDVVLTIADRYETMGTAIAASYLNIPLVHVQGGEITGNIDEKVRHAVTKLSDLHVVATEEAGRRLRQMGEAADSIHVTGCPSVDLVPEAMTISRETVAQEIARIESGAPIDLAQPFVVVLQHPETENHEDAFRQMTLTLEAVAGTGHQAIVFWPNIDAGSDSTSKAIRMFRESGRDERFAFVKNLEGHTFLALLNHCDALIGNSSVGIREASFVGVPVVNVGDRQLGRERGRNVIDAPWEAERIAGALAKQIAHGRYPRDLLYGDGQSGARIAALVATAEITPFKRFQDAE